MNKFEKLIRDGFVEIDTASKENFDRAIENSHLKLSKVSVSDDNLFLLLGTEDERDQVEMRRGMTYFYNPLMWRVKSLDNKDDTNGRKEMTYIYENRSVRHDAGPDMRFQLKEFLMQEVNRAWAENNPCGGISCSWDEDYLTVSILSSDKTIASTSYSIVREDEND